SSFFFSSRRRHTRFSRDWSSDVCSSDLGPAIPVTDNATSPPRTSSAPSAISRATSSLTAPCAASVDACTPSSACFSRLLYTTTRSEERRVGKERGSQRASKQYQRKNERQ